MTLRYGIVGGGVLCDMGCHSRALSWYALTPPGREPSFLVPQKVQADGALLKWGQPHCRELLRGRHGVDYAHPSRRGLRHRIVAYANPETGQRGKGQFSVSWIDDKQGLRLLLDALGPGYAPRFGLVAVDRTTQQRTPKPSAVLLGEVARSGRFDPTRFG